MTVPAQSSASRLLRRPPAGNLATGWLKVIALVFMLIDHSGKVLFNNIQEMRILGRIAFPLYLWCMVVGFTRTRSVPRYLLRIFWVFLFSQPLYFLALDYQGHIGTLISSACQPLAGLTLSGDGFGAVMAGLGQVLKNVYGKPNILLTLLLGLSALWGIREKKGFSQIWAPALAVILATVLDADYGWKGVVLLMMLYAVRDSRPGIAAVMIAFFLYWGTSYRVTSSLFGISFDVMKLPDWISSPLSAFLRLETYALLALPLMLVRFPGDLKMPRWVGYALYPAHLVLLIALKLIVWGW